MDCGPEPEPETIKATVRLNLAGSPLEAEITVPTRPFPLPMMLPILRSLAETVIGQAVRSEAARGLSVSCRSGCGACCRQIVPITEVEARRLRDLVEQLPEPRRSAVRARFAEAAGVLEAAGLMGTLRQPRALPDDEVNAFGLRYFALGIPCPFLEDESCSIYEERPIACREYLVTSPRENCSSPTAETVRRVELSAKVSTALGRMPANPEQASPRWVPLVLAPEWADAHPDERPEKPGPEWLREFFQILTGVRIPAPPSTGDSGKP